jgi:DNA polymerase-3 subunit epsilon
MRILRGSILDRPLVFVDIETNGLSAKNGRVIEVAAIRVENGDITRTFSSLIDPETDVPYFITQLTGITNDDIEGAPVFSAIADDLWNVLSGALFVAHNVSFDYSFLYEEFNRLEKPFALERLCTVKLSRALYPEEKSHKLENLIARHDFSYTNRHRAYDDAAVLIQFIKHAQCTFGANQLEKALSRQFTA